MWPSSGFCRLLGIFTEFLVVPGTGTLGVVAGIGGQQVDELVSGTLLWLLAGTQGGEHVLGIGEDRVCFS